MHSSFFVGDIVEVSCECQARWQMERNDSRGVRAEICLSHMGQTGVRPSIGDKGCEQARDSVAFDWFWLATERRSALRAGSNVAEGPWSADRNAKGSQQLPSLVRMRSFDFVVSIWSVAGQIKREACFAGSPRTGVSRPLGDYEMHRSFILDITFWRSIATFISTASRNQSHLPPRGKLYWYPLTPPCSLGKIPRSIESAMAW